MPKTYIYILKLSCGAFAIFRTRDQILAVGDYHLGREIVEIIDFLEAA